MSAVELKRDPATERLHLNHGPLYAGRVVSNPGVSACGDGRKSANEADVAHGHELMHGKEGQVHGNGGYPGLDKRGEVLEAQDKRRLRKEIDWPIALKRRQIKAMPDCPAKALYEWHERGRA